MSKDEVGAPVRAKRADYGFPYYTAL